MAITYTWTIPTVQKIIATGGIDVIHWRCDAVDGDHSVGSYGTVKTAWAAHVAATTPE